MFGLFGRKSKAGKQLRIFDVTDIHGSNVCFRKLCGALDFYKVDVLILGGDTTGKMVVPIIAQQNNRYRSTFSGKEFILESEEEIKKFVERMRDMGFYPRKMSPDEFDAISESPEEQERIFHDMMAERWHEWIDYAAGKFKGRDVRIYCAPGNDDEEFIDKIIEESGIFELIESRLVILPDEREMITSAWSNPTPWDTPRECSEEELEKKLEPLVKQIQNVETAVFNFHAPPYNSKIDECSELDEDLKAVSRAGQPVMKPVGSTTVRKLIEIYQPLLGIHGHIHEGKGTYTIGRTLCINPGSYYTEGVLQGVIITLEADKVVNLHFTTG